MLNAVGNRFLKGELELLFAVLVYGPQTERYLWMWG